MGDAPTRLVARCAACGRVLGWLSVPDGWTWTALPARLVHRRRMIEEREADYGTDDLPHAPYDDFRMRTVESVRETLERGPGSADGSVRGPLLMTPRFRIWEYPYTCDADTCMGALGSEWKSDRDKGPPFIRMPGRILS